MTFAWFFFGLLILIVGILIGAGGAVLWWALASDNGR